MCKKKIMLFKENKGKWEHKTKNINNVWMTDKSRNQPGLQKGLYIQDALKPSGITYVKTVLIVMLKISSLFLNLHNTSKAVLKYTLYIFLIVSPTSWMCIRLFHILKQGGSES